VTLLISELLVMIYSPAPVLQMLLLGAGLISFHLSTVSVSGFSAVCRISSFSLLNKTLSQYKTAQQVFLVISHRVVLPCVTLAFCQICPCIEDFPRFVLADY
jgi:ABC-type antimicrobial peptide transport system permease subunit